MCSLETKVAKLAIVPTPPAFEAALERGDTCCLRIDTRPASIEGVFIFHLPFRPGFAGLRRAVSIARAFLRGLDSRGEPCGR